MKLIIAIAIQHAIDFEDVGVGVGTRELVAGAIEAQDKLFASVGWSLRKCSIFHVVVVET